MKFTVATTNEAIQVLRHFHDMCVSGAVSLCNQSHDLITRQNTWIKSVSISLIWNCFSFWSSEGSHGGCSWSPLTLGCVSVSGHFTYMSYNCSSEADSKMKGVAESLGQVMAGHWTTVYWIFHSCGLMGRMEKRMFCQRLNMRCILVVFGSSMLNFLVKIPKTFIRRTTL